MKYNEITKEVWETLGYHEVSDFKIPNTKYVDNELYYCLDDKPTKKDLLLNGKIIAIRDNLLSPSSKMYFSKKTERSTERFSVPVCRGSSYNELTHYSIVIESELSDNLIIIDGDNVDELMYDLDDLLLVTHENEAIMKEYITTLIHLNRLNCKI